MFPAARKGDPITHDMTVPSGVILPPVSGPCAGFGQVIIEFLPGAHVNCTTLCSGAISGGITHPPIPPPPQPILLGCSTVFIHGLPAARWAPSGDMGFCGVFLGDPKLSASRTVLIGGPTTPFPVIVLPNGIQFGMGNIIIKGDPEFQAKTLAALSEIAATPTGKKLLQSIDSSGKTVTIVETTGGNSLDPVSIANAFSKDGKPGPGEDATVNFNPDRDKIGDEPWETRPPAIGLAHELVHADQATHGTFTPGESDNDNKPDPADPTKNAQQSNFELETAGIPPHDNRDFNENKIRREWDPPQPQREYY